MQDALTTVDVAVEYLYRARKEIPAHVKRSTRRIGIGMALEHLNAARSLILSCCVADISPGDKWQPEHDAATNPAERKDNA
jgi:hypothetical protein